MRLKVMTTMRPGTGYKAGEIVEVDDSKIVKTEKGLLAILNPAWDSQFENAGYPPMPKYSVYFEEVA